MHVDGFRFDLAAILGAVPTARCWRIRRCFSTSRNIRCWPGTKLIAEAWDAAGLSQLGKFPAWGRWAEFNGWFRDDVRRFLRGDAGAGGAVAKRICGSLDLYGESSRHRITPSISSPATMASRSTIWSPTTTSTTRPTARTTRTAGTTI